MNWWREALKEGRTNWLQSFSTRHVSSTLSSPAISITFDDVPLSAYHNGLPLLDRFGIKATFYICSGFQGTEATQHMGPAEVQRLAQGGHEIGCHTYSHYRLSTGSVSGLLEDAAKNRIAISQNSRPPSAFSYPFGELDFGAKRGLQGHYGTLRSARKGVNTGVIDMNCLRAISVYTGKITLNDISMWLDRAARDKAWLIFYTHGVSERPGEHDIEISFFEKFLKLCAERSWPILPISAAAALVAND